jgi:hypothetical protein
MSSFCCTNPWYYIVINYIFNLELQFLYKNNLLLSSKKTRFPKISLAISLESIKPIKEY